MENDSDHVHGPSDLLRLEVRDACFATELEAGNSARCAVPRSSEVPNSHLLFMSAQVSPDQYIAPTYDTDTPIWPGCGAPPRCRVQSLSTGAIPAGEGTHVADRHKQPAVADRKRIPGGSI